MLDFVAFNWLIFKCLLIPIEPQVARLRGWARVLRLTWVFSSMIRCCHRLMHHPCDLVEIGIGKSGTRREGEISRCWRTAHDRLSCVLNKTSRYHSDARSLRSVSLHGHLIGERESTDRPNPTDLHGRKIPTGLCFPPPRSHEPCASV